MRRRAFEFGLALVVLLAVGLSTSCKSSSYDRIQEGPNQPATPISTQGATVSASWAYPFVRWNERNYTITATSVAHVGQLLGTVTSYSDKEGSYTGVFSNAYPVGTKLYVIPNVDTAKKIAVQTGDATYVVAKVRD